MSATDLPSLNALLNGTSTLLLAGGYVAIRRHRPDTHKKFMIAALVSSALFLASYLVYHAGVGSVPYPHHDWSRPVYFAILIPHVILAAVMVPFIFLAVWYGFRRDFGKHVRITRWLWPVWVYVSLSGVVIYLMLYTI